MGPFLPGPFAWRVSTGRRPYPSPCAYLLVHRRFIFLKETHRDAIQIHRAQVLPIQNGRRRTFPSRSVCPFSHLSLLHGVNRRESKCAVRLFIAGLSPPFPIESGPLVFLHA